MAQSAMGDGFRAVLRNPGLALAELAWRWCFGIAGWTLAFLTFREYLDSIRFTAAEWSLIRTRQPLLIAESIAHALQGSGARLIKGSIIVTLGLVVLWIFAASVGRAAALKALLPRPTQTRFSALVGLNFLRAALLLATVVGYLGAMVLAGFLWPVDPADSERFAAAVLLFLALAVAVAFFWSILNWFLSVAPIFVMREGRETWGAIGDAVGFYRRRAGTLTGVTLLFDIFRFVLAAVATVAVFMRFSHVSGGAPLRPAVWAALGVTLVYCAAADVLYVIRLAVYVRLVEPAAPEAPAEPVMAPSAPISMP